MYGDLQWTTGDGSGGTNGLSGTEALVGINAGDGINFVTVPGSLTPSIINIISTSNSDFPGLWIFKVDEGMQAATIYVHICICICKCVCTDYKI